MAPRTCPGHEPLAGPRPGRHGRGDQAAGAFRETVEELVGTWGAAVASSPGATGATGATGDPGASGALGTQAPSISSEYGLLLDTMARAAPVFPPSEDDGQAAATRMEGPDGALRLLQTALETDADGPMIDRAVSSLTARGQVVQVLRLTDAWPDEGEAAKDDPPGAVAPAAPALALRLRRDLATPAELSRLLAHGEIEAGVIADMAERVGEAALEALLDALENSDSRQVRRRAFDALAGLGTALSRGLTPRIPELASDPRWFVRRNLLSLLRNSGEIPDGFSPLPFLEDADARVRRVALQMAIELPEARSEALGQALADPDAGVVRTALLELQSGVPAPVVPVIVREILVPGAHPDLRPLAFRALRGCTSRVALDAALEALDGGRSLLGRRRLPAPSAEVREALAVALSPPWADHADVNWVAAAAAQAREPEYATWLRELAAEA
ncbi:hypothetical protein BH23GEM11_BH23GEM11_06950 [soil metagenome]